MKTLYNEYNMACSKPAIALQDRVYNFINDLMNEYEAEGYNPREVSHLAISCIVSIESEHTLKASLNKIKK